MRLGCAEIGVVNTQPTLVKRALRTLTLRCHAPAKISFIRTHEVGLSIALEKCLAIARSRPLLRSCAHVGPRVHPGTHRSLRADVGFSWSTTVRIN
jgi:hypothetical protein